MQTLAYYTIRSDIESGGKFPKDRKDSNLTLSSTLIDRSVINTINPELIHNA